MDSINIGKMFDLDLIICILNNLPEQYDVALYKMESRLRLGDNDKDKLVIKNIQDKLNNQFERIKHNMDESDIKENQENKALMAYVKPFKGICNKRGKYGHTGMNCPNGNSATRHHNMVRGPCHYWGKHGHFRVSC